MGKARSSFESRFLVVHYQQGWIEVGSDFVAMYVKRMATVTDGD